MIQTIISVLGMMLCWVIGAFMGAWWGSKSKTIGNFKSLVGLLLTILIWIIIYNVGYWLIAVFL